MGLKVFAARSLSVLAASAVLVTAPQAGAVEAKPGAAVSVRGSDALPEPAAVLGMLDRAASAQIRQLRERPHGFTPDAIQDPTVNWVSAAFYTGLTRLTRVSDRSGGSQFLKEVAEHFNYGLRGAGSDHSRLDADEIAIGETYEELYARSGEPGLVAPLRERLDWTLPYLTAEPAPQRLTWWWCDALFMAPPVMARMSAQTGDMAYIDAMDRQWWRTYAALWSADHGLYYRDARFAARRSPSGKPVFWSRGNGWVMGGLARVLESMPANYPSRGRYIATMQAMAASLVRLQQADGSWPASLLDPAAPAGPESTGTAFFVYGLAWGINHGILDRAEYLPAVLRGWSALAGMVQADGLPGFAQRAGDQPWPTRPEDHALYGTGAFLLAGLEVMRLGEPVSMLPLREPAPGPRAKFRPFEPATVPVFASAEEKAGYERFIAERRAVYELAFEPARDMPGAAEDGQGITARADGIVNPRLTLPLAPPPAAERQLRATVRFAPYRYDDLLWENDRTAHRIYGPALQAFEPPSGSGIDAWGKLAVWPFMERQLKTGKQHDFHGEGIDFYNVGSTRGAGGTGVWFDNKLWTSRNWARYRILKDGPDVADFRVDYAPWPVGTARTVAETRRITLPLGTNFTRMTSTFSSNRKGPLRVAIGIEKRPTTAPGDSAFMQDRARGRFSLWTPTDPDKGAMGVAVMVDPAMIAEVREDADNYLILIDILPGKPFVYYMGAAWSKGRDFHDAAAWEAYVAAQAPDFRPSP